MLELLIIAILAGVVGLALMSVLFSLILLPFKPVFGLLKCGLWLIIGIPLVLAALVVALVLLSVSLLIFPLLLVLALPFLLVYAVF